jgi:hypothetical protein
MFKMPAAAEVIKMALLKPFELLKPKKEVIGKPCNNLLGFSSLCRNGTKQKSGILTSKTKNKPKFSHLVKSPINKISKKRQKQLRIDSKVRQGLINESGGVSQISRKRPDFRGLQCHELKFRSHGGKVTKINSRIITGREHSLKHGIIEVDSNPKFRWIP